MFASVDDVAERLEYAMAEQNWDIVLEVIKELRQFDPIDEDARDNELDVTMDVE